MTALRRFSRNRLYRSWLYPKREVFLLLPQLIGFSVFYLYSFVLALRYSMLDSNARPVFVGFRHYVDVLSNEYFQVALINTGAFCLISVSTCLVVGYFLAMVVFQHPRFRWASSTALFPLLLPTAALTLIWRILMNGQGVLASTMYSALPTVFYPAMWPRLSLYAFFLWRFLGVSILLHLGGLTHIDKSAVEAARMEGASGLRLSRLVILPMMRKTTLFIMVYLTVCALRIFREAYLLYGAYPPRALYFAQHYMNNHFQKLNYQRLSASAVILSVLVSLLFLAIMGTYEARERR